MGYISLENVLALAATFVTLGLLRIFIDYRLALSAINHPGYTLLLRHGGILASIIPRRIWGISLGRGFAIKRKHEPFQELGWDIICMINLFPHVTTQLMLADPAAIKEVTSSRNTWPKPVQQYTVLSFFGRNIVASEGEEWKRYRKICAPAFSDKNNRLVWDETCQIMSDIFDNAWAEKHTISFDNCVDLTLQVALAVIGIAGFGHRIRSADDHVIPAGHQMTFKDSLHTVSTDVGARLIFPKWAMIFTARLRKVRLAFDELEQYMLEMIHSRKNSERNKQRYDLFSSLLEANDDEDISGDNVKLSTSELLGNVFIFQLAGHETTAHTLAFTFGLLALYQGEQEKLFQHIKEVLADGRSPTYDDMPLLTYSMAVFYETLRMFPPVPNIPKWSSEDTVLTASNSAGKTTKIPVSKGTGISIVTPALHYNPRYWAEPHSFKPARFLGDWPRDAFVPFSAGARACLGRKFFETEGIAALTTLVSRYKIELHPEFATGTLEEKREKLLATRSGLTLTPLRIPLVFERR